MIIIKCKYNISHVYCTKLHKVIFFSLQDRRHFPPDFRSHVVRINYNFTMSLGQLQESADLIK